MCDSICVTYIQINCENEKMSILSATSKLRPRRHTFITKIGKIWGTPSYRKDSTFIFRARPKAVFTVCLVVCLLHSLGVQTHCASASSADGIHETSSCRIPVSSCCQRICRPWLAPENLVRWAWYTILWQPRLFCIFISVPRKREELNTSIEISMEINAFQRDKIQFSCRERETRMFRQCWY